MVAPVDDSERASISDAAFTPAEPMGIAIDLNREPDTAADVTTIIGVRPARGFGRMAAGIAIGMFVCLSIVTARLATAPTEPSATLANPSDVTSTPVGSATSEAAPGASDRLPPSPGAFAPPPPPAGGEPPLSASAGGDEVVKKVEVSRDAVNWHRAANRCRGRRDEDGRPLRLPSVDEAQVLHRQSGASGPVWTRTRSNEPNANWIVGAAGKLRSADKSDNAARVICVRD